MWSEGAEAGTSEEDEGVCAIFSAMDCLITGPMTVGMIRSNLITCMH